MTPFVVNKVGKPFEVSKELHLFDHWTRSQRASQLVADYHFDVMDLMAWSSWLDYNTALLYAKKGSTALSESMQKANATYG